MSRGGHTIQMPDASLDFFTPAPAAPPPAQAAGEPPATDPAPPTAKAAGGAARTPAPARQAAKAATGRRPGRRQRVRSAADDGTGVSLPISLVDRLRGYAKAHAGRSYTDITLDAIEASHERLSRLLTPSLPPRRDGPLFAGRPPRRAQHGEHHVQVNLRFGAEDLAVIDELWPTVGAPNRSAMLAAALDDYLP